MTHQIDNMMNKLMGRQMNNEISQNEIKNF